jgi:hypothetical protein
VRFAHKIHIHTAKTVLLEALFTKQENKIQKYNDIRAVQAYRSKNHEILKFNVFIFRYVPTIKCKKKSNAISSLTEKCEFHIIIESEFR